MTKLRIHITKEVLEQSAYCSVDPAKQYKNKDNNNASENCAIACAVDKIIPNAGVGISLIHVRKKGMMKSERLFTIELPEIAVRFISEFDSCLSPETRMNMTPFHFDVELTDEQLAEVMKLNNFNEEEFKRVVNECTTMSFVE